MPIKKLPPETLAADILTAIELEPSGFHMRHWANSEFGHLLTPEQSPAACGTTLCIAGWALHLSGYSLETAKGTTHVLAEDGHLSLISDVATELLGLHDYEAEELFWCTHNTPLAKEMLKQVAAGERVNERRAMESLNAE